MKRSHWFVTIIVCVSLTACGGDDEALVDASLPAADATASIDAAPIDAAPIDAVSIDALPVAGKLTVVAENLTGLVGKILLVSAVQGPTRAAGACEAISQTPQTVTTVLKTLDAPMGDPCTLGAEADLSPGIYQVSAGVYTPGQMTPEQCATTTATVDGATTVTLPALGACN